MLTLPPAWALSVHSFGFSLAIIHCKYDLHLVGSWTRLEITSGPGFALIIFRFKKLRILNFCLSFLSKVINHLTIVFTSHFRSIFVSTILLLLLFILRWVFSLSRFSGQNSMFHLINRRIILILLASYLF